MLLLTLLIVMPLIPAALLWLCPADGARRVIVWISAVVISVASLALLLPRFPFELHGFAVDPDWIGKLMFAVEAALGIYILALGIRFRKHVVSVLIVAQMAVMTAFELREGHALRCTRYLFADRFSVLMGLIIGIIASLICIYALGYMKEFHEQHHKDFKDNRRGFFALLFLFISAMFGIVFANNLLWLYFFWEITTLCSFLLIRYKGNSESVENAFHALAMNLLGGLAFAVAIVYLHATAGTVELDRMLALGKAGALLPAVLISFAGITKSAQLPFSSWLVGAMVAPTPVSALLHSSTMVKAGVYVVIRLAPILQGTVAGFAVALVGGVTFLVASFIAVSQSDAKKVLAYSTVANLGLVVLCGGIGTAEAVWAGILLILFHAIAKGLLFLCVGVVEHRVHSRNIEAMSGLIISMPRLSIMMQVGMAGMFLAPFGMLLSKWAVLRALVDRDPVLAVFVIFGSAATLFFWVKWLGKLLEVSKPHEDVEQGISRNEWFALGTLSVLTVGVCGFFPFVSSALIQPYLVDLYARTVSMGHGNVFIMTIMLGMVALFPLSFLRYGRRVKVVDAYLGGGNADSSTVFRGAAGTTRKMSMENYYLADCFPAAKLSDIGGLVCAVLLIVMIGVAWL